MLGRVDVEHEVRERTMQAGEIAAQEREARTGHLGRGGEIEQAERLAEIDVILDRELERARGAPATQLHVVLGRAAHGRAGMRKIGQVEHEVAQRSLHPRKLRFERLELVAQSRHFGQGSGCVLAAPFRRADLLAGDVALLLQLLGACLDVLARRLERFERGRVQRDAALRQRSSDSGKVVAQQVDVEHA